MVKFIDYAAARAAGYRKRGREKDTSGANWFGYEYTDKLGNKTESVLIESLGKYMPLFPPREGE